MKPENFVELNMCFDKDFDMENVTDMVGFQPSKMKRQSETRVNPITGEQNLGYWLLTTDKVYSDDSLDVQDAFVERVISNLEKIKSALDTFEGEAVIGFVIPDEAYYEKTKPELSGQILLDDMVLNTKKYKTYDSEDIVKELEEVVLIHSEPIKNALEKADTKALFRITANVHNENYPSLGVEPKFLNLVEQLNGSVEFCVYPKNNS